MFEEQSDRLRIPSRSSINVREARVEEKNGVKSLGMNQKSCAVMPLSIPEEKGLKSFHPFELRPPNRQNP